MAVQPPGDAPILEFDPSRDAVIEPTAVEYVAAGLGQAAGSMPPRVVLCYFQDVIETIVLEHEARRVATLRSEIGPNAVYPGTRRADLRWCIPASERRLPPGSSRS